MFQSRLQSDGLVLSLEHIHDVSERIQERQIRYIVTSSDLERLPRVPISIYK